MAKLDRTGSSDILENTSLASNGAIGSNTMKYISIK
jgi:hypothetical protein